MEYGKRDLLLLLKTNGIEQQSLDKEVEGLNRILVGVEKTEVFCQVHEVVTRTRITSKPKRILKAVAKFELKPFCFLLNKN